MMSASTALLTELHRPHADASDEDLLRLIANGREPALGELYLRHGQRSLALASRMLRDHAAAEEVVQDGFVAVWRRARTFNQDVGSAKTWVLAIVRNRAIDELRRRRKHHNLTPLDDARVTPVSHDDSRDPQHRLEFDDLRSALRSIPAVQRQAVQLSYLDGYSVAEVADMTGVSPGTVKSRIRLAKERLRQEPLLSGEDAAVTTNPRTRVQELVA